MTTRATAQASKAAIRKSTAIHADVGLSKSGIAFFGSLCVGTFGLGCWQAQRYFEKISMIEQREDDLGMEPSESNEVLTDMASFRRRLVNGIYHHDLEILVGPRGPPPGALAQDGPSSGRSGGGMASSPQGYYVVTPLERSDGTKILINRGWVPRHFVKESHSSAARVSWPRPSGQVQVIGAPSPTEKPRFLTPQHTNLDKKRIELYWFDRTIMEQISGIPKDQSIMLTQVADAQNNSSTSTIATAPGVSFPAKPSLATVGEYKVSPTVHAGYGFTWFGLSGAGWIMTRKLMTRGRA